MNWKELPAKKTVKLLTLLLTSLLIASVSAAVYYSMSMVPTVTIAQAAVIFEAGADDSSTACNVTVGTNSTYASLSLKAYPNATLTYTEPLNISNTDASSAKNVRLSHVSITPNATTDVANFTYINFTLIQPNGNPVAGSDFDYTVSGNNWQAPSDMTYASLAASTEWAVMIETRAVAGATAGIDVTIVIELDVQE